MSSKTCKEYRDFNYCIKSHIASLRNFFSCKLSSAYLSYSYEQSGFGY